MFNSGRIEERERKARVSFQRFRDCRDIELELMLQGRSAKIPEEPKVKLSAEMYLGNSCDNEETEYASGWDITEALHRTYKKHCQYLCESLDHMTILHHTERRKQFVIGAVNENKDKKKIDFDFRGTSRCNSGIYTHVTILDEKGFVPEEEPVVKTVRHLLWKRLIVDEQEMRTGDGSYYGY